MNGRMDGIVQGAHAKGRRGGAGRTGAAGVTLAELLTALAVGALLMAVALPRFDGLLARERAGSAMNQMLGAVQFTRAAAVSHRVTAALCPGAGDRCGRRNTWHDGALAFLDPNGNGQRDSGEEILLRLPPLPAGHRMYWRAFRNRTALVFRPSGLTDWQSGNILYCPPGGDATLARQVVLNAQGRARPAIDTDGDGIVEDASGRAVTCPAA